MYFTTQQLITPKIKNFKDFIVSFSTIKPQIMKTKILFIASLVAFTFFTSCDSNDKSNDPATSSVTSDQVATDAKIDATIDDVSTIIDDQYTMRQSITSKTGTHPKSMLPSCALTTWTYVDGIFTGSIDFGTEGCALENGNILKGKITLSFSGNFTSPEQTISYTFDNFYHNGKKIQGSKTITRTQESTELLEAIHPVYTCTIDMTITFEDETVYSRIGNNTREYIEGFDTIDDCYDNVFLVTGTQTTNKPNGDTWQSTIKTPLRYESACKKPFPVSGTISKVKNGVETLVDYGNGECDNLATITTDGVTTPIELKK